MIAIGFNFFRKFERLEPIVLGGISFLVGKNNAGKSTIVKALMLLNNYLKSSQIQKFSLANGLDGVSNVGTYGRALHKNAKQDFIAFTVCIRQFRIEVTITGLPDDTEAEVIQLFIFDADSKHSFFIDFQSHSISISKDMEGQLELFDVDSEIERLETEVSDLRHKLFLQGLKKSSREYITQQAEINAIEAKIETLTKSKKDYSSAMARYHVRTDEDDTMGFGFGGYIFTEIIEDTLSILSKRYTSEFNGIQEGKKATKFFADRKALQEDKPNVERALERFVEQVLKPCHFKYLGSSLNKQSTLFLIRDKSNALTQAIHEFFQSKIQPGDIGYGFADKWMKVLEVGDSFVITPRAGEAYELEILEGKSRQHLADKGSGSIQAMLLVLRIATLVHQLSRKLHFTTVFIEEPEINLHPGLQSKLTDMFFECFEKYRMSFLVETHSEYMIRRSQVIVAKNELEVAPNENPFRIYYFPTEENTQPYQIKYNADGSLDKNFGSGFYDEASSATLDLIRLKRLSKN